MAQLHKLLAYLQDKIQLQTKQTSKTTRQPNTLPYSRTTLIGNGTEKTPMLGFSGHVQTKRFPNIKRQGKGKGKSIAMGVNSLPKTGTRQRRDCDSNPCSSEAESGTLTTRPPRASNKSKH